MKLSKVEMIREYINSWTPLPDAQVARGAYRLFVEAVREEAIKHILRGTMIWQSGSLEIVKK